MSEDRKTIGDGIAFLTTSLIDSVKQLVAAVGEKAGEAIGPATTIVSTLMSQYVEEQKAAAKKEWITSIVQLLCGALLFLVGCALIGAAVYTGKESRDLPVFIMFAVFTGVPGLVLFINGTVHMFVAMERESKITSSSVDTLLMQFARLRNSR